MATSTLGSRGDIEGLRAVAVVLVVLYHAGLPGFSGGFVGVDVFFVISGFLVTRQLHDLKFIDRGMLAAFYARRVRRLMPAALSVIALSVAAAAISCSPLQMEAITRDAAAAASLSSNVLYAWRGLDYLAHTDAPSLFLHFWSLGVEGQFYLIWPLLLVAASRSKVSMRVAVVLAAFISFSASVWLTHRSQPLAFFLPLTRLWEFCGGAVIAVYDGKRSTPEKPHAWLDGRGIFGLAAIALSSNLYQTSTPYPGFAALLPVLGSALLIGSGGTANQTIVSRALAWSPMQWLGKRSYAIYLVHWPIFLCGRRLQAESDIGAMATLLASLATSLVLAYLLHRFVETPIRYWKRTPSQTLTGWVSLCFLVVAVMGSGYAWATSRASASSGQTAETAAIGAQLQFTPYVPKNLMPALGDAADDVPVLYSDGCHLMYPGSAAQTKCSFGPADAHTTIALFGDSHAAQWFPALDDIVSHHSLRIEVYTKSDCSAVFNDDYSECRQWRENVLKVLSATPPDIVVMSSFEEYARDTRAWEQNLSNVVTQLHHRSKVVVISDTPHFATTPAICLSTHLQDAFACGASTNDALVPQRAQAFAHTAQEAGADVINMDSNMCSASRCEPIIGNRLVYRDEHHLTASFARFLAPKLWAALKPIVESK